MKRIVLSLVFALALAIGGAAILNATTTTTSTSTSSTLLPNDSTLTYSVVGTIQGLPGSPPIVSFTCSTTEAAPFCQTTVGNVILNVDASDTSHFRVQFKPSQVCGATTSACTPLSFAADADNVTFSTTLSSCTYTGNTTSKFYFPVSCGNCFGGENPWITLHVAVTSSAVC